MDHAHVRRLTVLRSVVIVPVRPIAFVPLALVLVGADDAQATERDRSRSSTDSTSTFLRDLSTI